MAPEQATGDPVGPQADVFSLGRVVAEAADVRCGHGLRKVLDKATAPTLLALSVPAAWIVEASRSALASRGRAAGFHASTGGLRVSSRPAGAEVYVDGALRGTTPLTLELAAGQHSVRVGSPRLSRWRAADVQMHPGSSGRLDFDLTE